jgi:hypothetical protein
MAKLSSLDRSPAVFGVQICRRLFLGTQGGWMQFCARSPYNAIVTLFAFNTNDLAAFNLLWIVFGRNAQIRIFTSSTATLCGERNT